MSAVQALLQDTAAALSPNAANDERTRALQSVGLAVGGALIAAFGAEPARRPSQALCATWIVHGATRALLRGSTHAPSDVEVAYYSGAVTRFLLDELPRLDVA